MTKYRNRKEFNYVLTSVIILITIFVLSCERPVSVSPPDEPPPDGSIFIESDPSEAQIFINGKDRRRLTPDSIKWLATGDYQVTLKKDFWHDTSFIVSVTEGEQTNVHVNYLSNLGMRGTINCTSNPTGTKVILDDSYREIDVPCVIKSVLPGYHTLKFVKENYRASEQTVIVRSGETTDVTGVLVDTTVWKEYNMETAGFPTNSLTAVLADSKGVLWVGTLDEGLLMYQNGIWTNYREANSSLPNKQVRCIEEGPKGNIWVGTFDGVWEISLPYTFIQWNKKNSILTDMYINEIVTEDEYVMWIATKNGVTKIEKIGSEYSWTTITTTNSDLVDDNVTAIAVNGYYKWFGTASKGITSFIVRQTMTNYTYNNGLARNAISSIAVDTNQTVWVGHSAQIHQTGGLSVYNGLYWENLSHLVHGEGVSTIFVDSHNGIWVGTSRALYVISGRQVANVFEYDTTGLDLQNVADISEDQNGLIWIATKANGLLRMDYYKLF